MYTHIINPKTGRKINVLGRTGINILKKYVEALHVMEGGMRGGSGTDGAASKTGDGDATVTIEVWSKEKYLARLGLLQKALFEIRPVCRKPGNEYTPAMLHALVQVFTIKASGSGSGSGSIYNEPSFIETLLKFRAISLFDSINEYQKYNSLGIVATERPRDIIIPFANALRIYGKEASGSLTPPTLSKGSGWATILPDLFKNPSANFSKIQLCIPQNRTFARDATGHGGGDYLNPVRLFNITAGIKKLCEQKVKPGQKIFINTLQKESEDGGASGGVHSDGPTEDDDVFSVFSGIDIEVIPFVTYTNDAFGVFLESMGVDIVASDFAEGSYWYPILVPDTTEKVWEKLKKSEDFTDLEDTHRLLGIYRPNSKTSACKVALIAKDTFEKISADDFSERYIILKMGQPGHYTIGLLDLTNNSIEYFDSEGALAYTPQYEREGRKTTTISYGLQAYKQIKHTGTTIDVVTPCTFALQTDDARTNYWEDGYCQSWVWLYIYERLNLGDGVEATAEATAEATTTALLGVEATVEKSAAAKKLAVIELLVNIYYAFFMTNYQEKKKDKDLRTKRRKIRSIKKLKRDMKGHIEQYTQYIKRRELGEYDQEAAKFSVEEWANGSGEGETESVRLKKQFILKNLHAMGSGEVNAMQAEFQEAASKAADDDSSSLVGTFRKPAMCYQNLSFFLNLSWVELLIKKNNPLFNYLKLINEQLFPDDVAGGPVKIPSVSSVLALFKKLETHA